MFFKKYNSNGIAMQLTSVDPRRFKSVRVAAKWIKHGWIGKMTDRNGTIKHEIKDPNYIPKNGEEFSRYDGMFGSDGWWTTENGKLVIVE